jgi:hypothetical protein
MAREQKSLLLEAVLWPTPCSDNLISKVQVHFGQRSYQPASYEAN